MNSENTYPKQKLEIKAVDKRNFKRLKLLLIGFSVFGTLLFGYFVYVVGVNEILLGITKIGFGGFAIILLLFLLKLAMRAWAWTLSVYEPYKLSFRDALPAVILGEALSSIFPLGILMSGTAKAIAVRKRVPLVVGFSSIATENLFYSLITGLFIVLGALTFLRRFALPETTVFLINFVIGFVLVSISLGVLIVIKQWHFASGICQWLYNRGILTKLLEGGRIQVRLFENLIYGFYRQHPRRFFPLCLLQIAFHLLGIFEVWFILSRISELFPAFSTAFFLESMSRLVTVVFKLVPFLVGVDEASAEFIVETLGIVAGIGVTLAIVRKGRILFWAGVGMLLILKRGFTFNQLSEITEQKAAD